MKRITAILLAVLMLGLTACTPQKDGGVTTTTQEAVTTTEAGKTITTTATTTKVGMTVTAEKPATTTGTVTSPASLRCYSIGEERDVVLSADEKAYIVSAIQSLSWKTDHYKCASGYMFYYDGNELYYHESCGSVNDNINHKAAKFSDEQVKAIDAMLGVGNNTTTDRTTVTTTEKTVATTTSKIAEVSTTTTKRTTAPLPMTNFTEKKVDGFTFRIAGGQATVCAGPASVRGKIVIPNSVEGYPVTGILYSGFNACEKMTSLTIPDSVTNIQIDAFDDCNRLTEFIVSENNPEYSSQDGVLFNKEKTVLLCYPDYKAEAVYTIPYGVVSIGVEAFKGNSRLTEVILSDSVRNIEAKAFKYAGKLTNVTFGGGLKSIGEGAFEGCQAMPAVRIPGTVTNIGDHAFYNCLALTSAILDNGVTNIGSSVFNECVSLTDIVLPNSVESIGTHAFSHCEALTSISIPEKVTSIGRNTFSGCYNLIDAVLPDGVESIGSYAFYNCLKLERVTVGKALTMVDEFAFYECSKITNVYYGGTEQDRKNIVFNRVNDTFRNATWHYNAK